MLQTIQQGDTLSELAEANNTTVENILYFNLEIDDPDKIHAGDELIMPPEGWELPELEPMRDADGNIILLAANGTGMAEDILAARAETTEENQPEEGDEQALREPTADINKAFLDFTQSRIDLRDAINSGDGLDIAREGTGFVSSLDDLADAGSGGFLDGSQEAIFDGIEHGIGLGQAIDDGDGWEIAGNSIDLIRAIDDYTDQNGGDFIDGDGRTALNIASSGFALAEALEANQACACERAF